MFDFLSILYPLFSVVSAKPLWSSQRTAYNRFSKHVTVSCDRGPSKAASLCTSFTQYRELAIEVRDEHVTSRIDEVLHHDWENSKALDLSDEAHLKELQKRWRRRPASEG